MAILADGLLPASFRGVPFAVESDSMGGGRRQAMHVYPGRDEPWAEDMGRAPRSWSMRGFIVDGDVLFLGGPIALQRLLFIAAVEAKGPGTLTHPTLGVLNVSVRRFSVGADLGAGKKALIDVDFIESGKRSFPSLLTNSSGLLTASNLMVVALVADGVRLVAAATSAGASRSDVADTSSSWTDEAVALGSDATALHRLAAQLPGNYGRYAGGGNVGLSGQLTTPYTTTTTIADLVGVASAARVAITEAADAVDTAVALADLSAPNSVAAAITALVRALAAACADPDDAIRLLEQLVAFGGGGRFQSTAIGNAIAGMFRRAAAAALATAVGAYQPTSADDAASLMSRMAILLDDLAIAAGDAGDDQSYTALRAVRVAIVKDLRQRGGLLAQITSFQFGRPLPSLALAQRLYRDPTRMTQLEGQVDPIHPLFMPTNFDALAA